MNGITFVTTANQSIIPSAINEEPSAGDPIPANCALIEVHVGEVKQLSNSINPSPFRHKDLDPAAEEFIVGWAKELPRDAELALVVDLDRPAGLADEATILRDAIHQFFRRRAVPYRRRLRELFRRGRTSLVIGLTVLAAAVAHYLAKLMKAGQIDGDFVSKSSRDRRLGFDVASAGNLSVRLVAHP